MKILHLSAECYPAAKVGGLADVVGSLPNYLNQLGVESHVILPKYGTKWLDQQEYETIYEQSFPYNGKDQAFQILKCLSNELNYPFFVVEMPGLFDREGVYANAEGQFFQDETERYIGYQHAVLQWVMNANLSYDIFHCHDHHTGFIPFMLNHVYDYKSLNNPPTVLTIHNGIYQGVHPWSKAHLIGNYEAHLGSLLDWNNNMNALASAIRLCWKLTSVSPGYLEGLRTNGGGLEWLYNTEIAKSQGILNGIDYDTWNPNQDPMLDFNLKRSYKKFKIENKKSLCAAYDIDPTDQLFVFIGRLVTQKGADFIPGAISEVLESYDNASFLLLGTGEKNVEYLFDQAAKKNPDKVKVVLSYDEVLAHKMYASSDFLLMPSREEPCGLNQMFAMHYGSIPIVHAVGGLRDTVTDVDEQENGNGFRFYELNSARLAETMKRAMEFAKNVERKINLMEENMKADFSWENSAQLYKDVYLSLLK
jgi:starch synthase